jgi:hypothetical protein
MAARIAEHVRRLVRSAVDLTLRLERAAAEFTRISLGRDSKLKDPLKTLEVWRARHTVAR